MRGLRPCSEFGLGGTGGGAARGLRVAFWKLMCAVAGRAWDQAVWNQFPNLTYNHHH